MRRIHWWGVGVGASVLVAAVGVPSAMATTHHPKTPPRNVVVVAKSHDGDHDGGHDGDHDGDHDGRGHGPKCHYPPHGKPDAHIASVSLVQGRRMVVTGTMTFNGCGYEGHSAGLYRLVKVDRKHGDHWQRVATGTTGAKGQVSFTVPATHSESFRLLTSGGDGFCQAWSEVYHQAARYDGRR